MLGSLARGPRQQNAAVEKPANRFLVRTARGAHARVAGFTLIEVMVALIVLVLGVLGAAAMTLSAIRDSKQSALRSQASALAYELSDLMRANFGNEGVFIGVAPGSVAACWSAGCTPAEMARNDYFEWRAKLTGSDGLPGGNAVICRDVTNLASDAVSYGTCDNLPASPLVVKLKWDEKSNNARDAGALATAVTTAYLVVPIQPY